MSLLLRPYFTEHMTKAELLKSISEEAGITRAQSAAALDQIVASITVSLKKGNKFSIPGLGTFSVKKRSARNGRNPFTGEAIKIKAKKVAKFKAAKSLQDKL